MAKKSEHDADLNPQCSRLLSLYLRLLLLCYPSDFRRRRAAEFIRLLKADLARSSTRRKAFLLLASLGDALSGGLRLRLIKSPPGRVFPLGSSKLFEQLRQDFAYALRKLVRRPGWTLAAVSTLALGIGATTAVFSLLNDVLLRPLPYPRAERLFELRAYFPQQQRLRRVISYPLCQSMGQAQRALSDFGCFAVNTLTADSGSGAERIRVGVLSWQILAALQVDPLIGRSFDSGDDEPDAERVALLSYGLWQEGYGGGEYVVGQSIRLEEQPYTILGVMPRGFVFPDDGPRLWVSMAGRPRVAHVNWLSTLGRLEEGWTEAQARTHFDSLRLQVPAAQPGRFEVAAIRPVGFTERLVGEVRPQLWIFFAAVAAVLLIACINVANLLLSRLAGRQRELALRSALGAGRRRLMAQMLSETLLLGLLGGAAGMALAFGLSSTLSSMAAPLVPRSHLLGLDGSAAIFAAGLSLGVGLFIGVLPALRGSRLELKGGLREAASTGNLHHHRLRTALTVAQIALAMMLLANAGLLLHSQQRLASTEIGFNSADLLTISPALPYERYRDPEVIAPFYDRMMQRLKSMLQIESASLTACLPFGGSLMTLDVWAEGQDPAVDPGEIVDMQVVDEEFFRVLGVSVIQGRLFDGRDRLGAPLAAVVNRTLASRVFPDGQALGRRLRLGKGRSAREVEIVGVVPDLRLYELTRQVQPMIYESILQRPEQAYPSIVARSSAGHGQALVPQVRALLRSIDSAVPLVGSPTLEDELRGRLAIPRFRTLLLSAFSIAALLLAAIGVYGVMAYGVAQRSREIGVRMALGARRRQILAWVVRRGLLLSAMGLLLGLAGALAASRLLESYLHDVGIYDEVSYLAAILLLSWCALLATYLPARRASLTDPLKALRCE